MPHHLQVDVARNRVYLKLEGLFSDDEARVAADETIASFGKMKPGFTCVTDISSFRPLTQEGVREVRRAGEAGLRLGMRATARVVGASAVAAQQFQRASKEGGYQSFTVATVEEADALLSGLDGKT